MSIIQEIESALAADRYCQRDVLRWLLELAKREACVSHAEPVTLRRFGEVNGIILGIPQEAHGHD